MDRTTILTSKLIRVVVDDGQINIEKCCNHATFDHGADYEMSLDDVDEAKALIDLLTAAVKLEDG